MRTLVLALWLSLLLLTPAAAEPVRLGKSEFNHGTSVDLLALTAEGERLVTSGGDGVLVVWDVKTKQVVHRLSERAGAGGLENAKAIAVSADGKQVAAVGHGPKFHVWSMETGKGRTLTFPGAHSVDHVCFGPKGRVAAYGAAGNGQVGVWGEGASALWIKEYLGGPHRLSWSPKGDTLAVLAVYGKGISLVDAASGRVRSEIATESPRDAVAFSPGGDLLAVTERGRVKLVDPASGKTLRTTGAHGASMLAFSPDGAVVISGAGSGHKVHAFEVKTLKQRWAIDIGQQVTGVSASEGLVAVGCRAPQSALYDLKTGALRTAKPVHREPIMALAWSPDGATVASGRDRIVLWDLAGKKVRATHDVLNGNVKQLHYLPGGDLLTLEGTYSTQVRRIDARGKARELFKTRNPSEGIAVSAKGKLFALARYRDQVLSIHDATTGKEVSKIEGAAFEPAFSPDGKLLAFRGERLRCWDLTTGKDAWTREGRWASASFHPKGGRALVSAVARRQLIVVEAATGRELKTLTGLFPTGPAYAPQGDLAVLAGERTLHLLDCATWTLSEPRETAGIVRSLAWSPKADRLAVGLQDGSLSLWSRSDLGAK